MTRSTSSVAMNSAFVCEISSVIRGVFDAKTISRLDVAVSDSVIDCSSSCVMVLTSASGHKIHDLPWPRCEANFASKIGK